MSNLKEISVVEAYVMDGVIDQPGHEDEVLIQLNGKFYDATACTDEELRTLIKINAA